MKISELLNIKGKVAVVTGASSGLGVTFAEALAGGGSKFSPCSKENGETQ